MQETINLPSTEEREVALEAFSETMMNEKNRSLGAVSVHDVEAEDTPLLVVREGNEVVPFISKGGLTVLSGAAKNGKSTALTLLMAAMLKEDGKIGCLERANSCKIGYIDTEQRKSDTIRIYKRILQLAGLPEEDDYSKLVVYNQRAFFKNEKVDALKEICEENRGGLVVLDNVTDYGNNINDSEQAQKVVEMLLSYSAQYDVALVAVIHTNKGDKNLRGHIGTFMIQKADTVVLVEKKRSCFVVSNKASRRQEIPDFRFWYNENNQLCVDENSVSESAPNTTMPPKGDIAETAIVDYLVEECDEQMATKREIVNYLEGEDICKKSLGYRVLSKMLKNGMLEEDSQTGKLFYCDSDAADELLSDDNQDITDQNVCLFNYSYPQRRF